MVNNSNKVSNPIKIFEHCENKTKKKVCTHKAQNTLVHIQLLRTSTVLHSPMASCSQRISSVVHSCYENNYILITLWTSLLMFHCVLMILILTQILSCYCLYRLINSYRL